MKGLLLKKKNFVSCILSSIHNWMKISDIFSRLDCNENLMVPLVTSWLAEFLYPDKSKKLYGNVVYGCLLEWFLNSSQNISLTFITLDPNNLCLHKHLLFPSTSNLQLYKDLASHGRWVAWMFPFLPESSLSF